MHHECSVQIQGHLEMEFLRCAPLQTNKQAETWGEVLWAYSALPVTSADAAADLFGVENAFYK